ncbi:hypothetical protein MTP99_009520 [Tenebrio molitor]|nr:hypothetical protein MTP99_009520 [Tenebrio molitor]
MERAVSFFWYDYILFAVLLILSTLIGFYFAYCGAKEDITNRYLINRKLKPLPIAISMLCSADIVPLLLMQPPEVYKYGGSYLLTSISLVVAAIANICIYLPVFYNAEIYTVYSYLEKRFDKRIKVLVSVFFVITNILFVSIVIYIVGLTFATASGTKPHIMILVVCLSCIFYTTIGGLKTVVWTDNLQFLVLVVAFVVAFGLGIKSIGGFHTLWNSAVDSGHLDIFDFDPDPTKRNNFWAIIVGLSVHLMSIIAVSQDFVQKYLCVSTFKQSTLAVTFYVIGAAVVNILGVCYGLLIYAKYESIDLLENTIISSDDQLVPYFVMEVTQNIPGLSGLFVAAIFGCALSALSTSLNCVIVIIYKDLLSKRSQSWDEKTSNKFVKVVSVVVGLISTGLIFLVGMEENVFPWIVSVIALYGGPTLGIFTLGVLFPKANAKGAFFGGMAGAFALGSILITAKYYESQETATLTSQQLFIDNSTWQNASNFRNDANQSEPFFLFRISFNYYTLVGVVVTIIVGLIVSYLTNQNDPPVDKKLISPLVHFLLPQERTLEMVQLNGNSI